MSFSQISRIAGSAMVAQTIRLNAIASNLANAESPAANAGAVYKARSPVFAAVYQRESMMDRKGLGGAQVKVLDVIETGASVQRYEPNHPQANPQGYVFYPDVNVVEQLADMMSARRSFDTNAEVIKSMQNMQKSVLRLGEP